MNLIDTFKISKKDIITIVGAGGKTSLMYSASSLLRKDYKVLVTTTTHIYIPDKSIYDEIIMLNDFPNENYHSILQNNKNGVYVIGNHTVNNSKIKDKVNFCGRLNENEVYSHLKETDIFISLNPSEPFGIVYAEAMLTNCKIVAPNTGGQNDFLKNYPLKENVDINDTNDISRAIDLLLTKKMNNIDSPKSYSNYFSYDRTVKIFMDYYNKYIERRIK